MARFTRAAAVTAARAERRKLASSKFANRLFAGRVSRRNRFSSHFMRVTCAPMRASNAPTSCPSRIVTFSTPRDSLVFALIPNRRAHPTSANEVSCPGQFTSKPLLRIGSPSWPDAKNAPRHAASAWSTVPLTTWGGNPRTCCPDRVTNPTRRITISTSSVIRSKYRAAFLDDVAPNSKSDTLMSKSSIMARRKRSAAARTSSSTSSTGLFATMLNSPANRIIAAISAMRTFCDFTSTRHSSSFTLVVKSSAIARFPSSYIQ